MQQRHIVSKAPKPGPALPPWLDRLLSIGIVASDPDVVRRQRCVNVGAFALSANAGSHLLLNAVYDFHGLLPIHAYNAAMLVAPLMVPRLHRLGENVAALTLALVAMVAHMFIVWAMGVASDLHVYYTLAGAFLLVFGVQHWRLFLLVFLLYLGALLIALNLAPLDGLIAPQDRALRTLLASHAMVNAIAINAIVLFYALSALQRAEIELKEQYDRSESLLAAVLPLPIAERLKCGGERRIADRIETLTVMFADIVGFTSAAHALPPEAVVAYLDRLVRVFDVLSERHGVEKIKTIGDSYMAAAGFDGRGREGALAAGRLALAMLAAMVDQPPLGGRVVRLRIGIHCGPATAGVIGDTRFSYDVWGDAVNTAARLESSGEAGRIHVSESFRALTLDRFVFADRGTIELRGIGAVRSYLLEAEKPSP